MDNLPSEGLRKCMHMLLPIKSNLSVLKQLSAHCFIHRCRICFNEWDNCFCYCPNCRTYLRFCQQIYYTKDSTYEDELNMIIALSE